MLFSSSLCDCARSRTSLTLSAARQMATLKDIQLRLKSIKNIAKITKSMKMIASTKLNRAQRAMEVGRSYGQSANYVYNHIKVKESESGEEARPVIVACSSDRGLCGAINSSISKLARKLVREDPKSIVAVLGDKAKPQIAREARKNISIHFNQVGRSIPTFLDAASIVTTILRQKMSISHFKILFNEFKSVIAYENRILKAFPVNRFEKGEKMTSYEVEDDALDNYAEYLFASQLFWALVEGHAAEMAAKRTAMENATKNAGEIISKLTMKYNRTRQAVITNELVDIITGASAL